MSDKALKYIKKLDKELGTAWSESYEDLSMHFQKFAEQHLEDILGEAEKKIKDENVSEPILELEDSLKPYSLGFANGAKFLLNLLKQRKG